MVNIQHFQPFIVLQEGQASVLLHTKIGKSWHITDTWGTFGEGHLHAARMAVQDVEEVPKRGISIWVGGEQYDYNIQHFIVLLRIQLLFTKEEEMKELA